MYRSLRAAGISAALVSFSPLAMADSVDDRLHALEKHLKYLESRVQDQDTVIKQKDAEIAALNETAGPDSWIAGTTISGVVEAEMVHTDNAGATADTEDFNLATFALGIESALTDYARANVVLKYEDGAASDDLTVDEATLTLTPAFMGPASFTIGKAGVPLAAFETLAASDPYTKTVGDLGGQRVAVLGFELDSGLYGSATAYRVENTGTATNADGGFELGYALENDNFSADVAVAYVNDAGAIGVGTKESTNLRASVSSGPFTVLAEHLKADSSTAGNADTKATNLELGYGFRMADMDSTFAVAWRELKDSSDNNADSATKSEKTLAALTLGVAENAAVILEVSDEEITGGTNNKRGIAKFVYDF